MLQLTIDHHKAMDTMDGEIRKANQADTVRALIARSANYPGQMLDSLELRRDLKVCHVDLLAIALTIEMQFGIDLPDEDISAWTTVADVVASVAGVAA